MLNHPTKRRWRSKTLTKHLADLVVVAAKHDSLVMNVSHLRDCAHGNDNDGKDRYRNDGDSGLTE